MKISRNDIQYIEVEHFEDCEFTTCIAYEMAIRNDRVIELVKNQLEYIERNNNLMDSDILDELLEKFYINELYLNYHFFSDLINSDEEKNMNGWRWIVTNRSGSPDIICCFNGLFVALEVKTEKGITSKLQEYHQKEILKSGGRALIVRSVEEVKALIEELKAT